MTDFPSFSSFALAAVCAASASLSFAPTLLAQGVPSGAPDPDGARSEPVRVVWDAPRPITTSVRDLPADVDALAPILPDVSFLSTDEDPEGDMPRNLAFTPDGQTVVVVHRDTDTVTWVDVATRTVVATADVGDFPTDVAIAPNGGFGS
jgi:YVTN family beta-propeller protein